MLLPQEEVDLVLRAPSIPFALLGRCARLCATARVAATFGPPGPWTLPVDARRRIARRLRALFSAELRAGRLDSHMHLKLEEVCRLGRPSDHPA